MPKKKIIIIGGGLSGLSAALNLDSKLYDISLIEAKPYLGGRVYSVLDSTQNDFIDNGQHLLMGCYKHTLTFLKTIGSTSLLHAQKQMEVKLIERDSQLHCLKASALPAPFHLLGALFRFEVLNLKDKLLIVKLMASLSFKSEKSLLKLDQFSSLEWLKNARQSPNLIRVFWEPLILATLNAKPEEVSAYLLAVVLKKAFLASKKDSQMIIPKKPLSEVFVDPALKVLKQRGIQIISQKKVHSFQKNEASKQILSLQTFSEEFKADYFILASDLEGAAFLLKPLEEEKLLAKIEALRNYSCILGIHLWFEKKWFEELFVGLIDSPLHWVFNRNLIEEKTSSNQHLTLIVSAADEKIIHLQKEDLKAFVLEELQHYFPQLKREDNPLIHFRVTKDLKATLRFLPNLENLRPQFQTAYSNLFLIGDWTKTGLPATIEGAIASGAELASFLNMKEVSSYGN